MKRARAGRPPQLVVASVLRLAGHGRLHDDASYITDEIKQESFAQDCVKCAPKKRLSILGSRDAAALQKNARRGRRGSGQGDHDRAKKACAESESTPTPRREIRSPNECMTTMLSAMAVARIAGGTLFTRIA